jgi:hypothetical protein
MKGNNDFVHVDLLPNVKRSRQFNVNVIVELTLAVVLSFVFIYIPYSRATVEFEESNGLNNNLKHELLLTQEEYAGYEIDLDALDYQSKIDLIKESKTDFNNYKDDLEIIVDLYDGMLSRITYDAESESIEVAIQMTSMLMYDTLNNSMLDISWVNYSTYITPRLLANGVMYESTFTIGVENNVE